MLFIVYVNDQTQYLSIVKSILFADDTAIYPPGPLLVPLVNTCAVNDVTIQPSPVIWTPTVCVCGGGGEAAKTSINKLLILQKITVRRIRLHSNRGTYIFQSTNYETRLAL